MSLSGGDAGHAGRPRDAAAGASPTGLSAAEAAARLARDGPNVLPAPRRAPVWRRLSAEMTHFFAVMLWIAGGLAFIAGLPQLGVAIFVVIVVNGLFSFAQEQRAESAAERLRELLPADVKVRRDEVLLTVPAADVVAGDLVVLAAGDRVPADLVLVAAASVRVDESMLTGESVPVDAAEHDQAWAGTYVVAGEGEGLVTATAGRTRLAGIAGLTSQVRRPRSPLARELDRLVRTIAVLAVGVGAAFFVVALLVGTPARDGFLFAVGVTVALVPEGLLPTVTLSLAVGAQRMAGRDALVRHLEAVETLGSATFICTDKTGTLTQNQMTVVEVWTPAGSVELSGLGYEPRAAVLGEPDAVRAAETAARAARLCSQGRIAHKDGVWVALGDPMEAAIDALARRLSRPGDPSAADVAPGPDVPGGPDGQDEPEGSTFPDPAVSARFPFDTSRRRESVLTDDLLLVKGAPEAVLPRCAAAHAADAAVAEMTGRGLRVLAAARRPAADVPAAATPDEAERDLELLGLLGLQDPPREDVTQALVACRRAGIRVAMLTGDHPATARAIASQIGLLGPDELVIEGSQLPDDEAVLGALIDRDGVVIGRIAPEDKLRITRALQARGHVVAMTGDGVNDGPALREADIGVAMGRSGTDVAREAADLVLLDDHFATIVAAIEYGRATYSNIRRFLTYHLTDNVAELTPFVVWALSGGQFPLALGVLQILCLDIGTDLLPALALGSEAPTAGVLDRPPEKRHLVDRRLLGRVFGYLGPAEALVEMLAFCVAMAAAGWRPGGDFPTGPALAAASGAAFAAVVIGQAGNAFACRSATRPAWELGWGTNRMLVWAVAVELAALVGFLVIEPLADLLDHAVPPPAGLAVALLAAPAVLLVDFVQKRTSRSNRRRAGQRR